MASKVGSALAAEGSEVSPHMKPGICPTPITKHPLGDCPIDNPIIGPLSVLLAVTWL